jgi:2-dehydropantoate 2-reductase
MKICILGSGALGSVIGGALTEAGSEVYLIRRSKEHVDQMNTKGLILREDSVDRKVEVCAATDCLNIGTVDLIIVLVKSYHTKEAITNALPIIGEQTVIMSLQNGFGNEEVIAEVAGKDHVLGGRTYVGGVMLGPGHVIAGIKGKHTYIGELDGTVTDRVTRIAEEFNRAGLLTTISPNIMGMMWDKLLINVATGALCAITKLPYGGLYKVPEIRECAFEAITEGINVAKAINVTLTTENREDIWLKAAEGLPDNFKTSMLQSLEKGTKTEVDYINGSVVRWGERLGIPTPVNKSLVANVKGIEFWMEHYTQKA